jgi:hypothetical protein
MAVDYGVSPSQLGVLLHNALIIVSIYWVPHYLRKRSADELRDMTPNPVLNALRERHATILVADCTEIDVEQAENLSLGYYLFSGKNWSPTVKFCLLVTLDHLVVEHSNVFGGGTPEAYTLQQVICESPAPLLTISIVSGRRADRAFFAVSCTYRRSRFS